jgi:hypothetical protein
MTAVCALPQLAIVSRRVACDGVASRARRLPGVNLVALRSGKVEAGAMAWECPFPGMCDGLGFGKLGSRRGAGRKREFVVEATSDASAEEEEEEGRVSILGKDVPKQQLQVGATATATILFSVSNRVLYKMALVPLKDYPFFLAQALTFGYVVVYGSFLFVRYRSGIVTREMLELPKMPFIILGGLEALGLAAGMAAAANLSGASIPILTQVLAYFSTLNLV